MSETEKQFLNPNKTNTKSQLFWAFYDWANSAFATTVIAGFFPLFFKQYWSSGVDVVVSTARLGLANSLAGLSVAFLAPLLGVLSDQLSAKKQFLFFFTSLGVLMTAALFFISKGAWQSAIGVYVLASIGFSGSIIFYDALLATVANKNDLDRVSSLGFSLGYLGGGLLFALNVWMTLDPQLFSLSSVAHAVRVSFLMVAIWWAFFSLPLFLGVKEDVLEKKKLSITLLLDRFIALKSLFFTIIKSRHIALFLLAYFFYMDGVGTIIRMAVDYGLSIGFQSQNLIAALLLIQFIGFPSAIIFGKMAVKFSAEKCIVFALLIYLIITLWGSLMSTVHEFYGLAVLVGCVQGGLQALSRSYFASLLPQTRSGEYFGVYNMVGRFSTVLGPLLMGSVAFLLYAIGKDSILATRVSILSVSSLFLIGLYVFLLSIKSSSVS